ncbi:MAG TPA: hypothetical protein VN260_06325 [Dissulfurispiraceae bacterium]|nr:hypothetical protein [Dissulfurispiraceae bacterium]
MLVKDKKHFNTGLAMAVAFFALFFAIMSPIFGEGRNGLEFSDDIFNKLSKGSAYYVPKTSAANEKFVGKAFDVEIKIDKAEDAKRMAGLFTAAGAMADQKEGTLKLSGDLGKVLSVVIRDSDTMYKNDGEKVKTAYGYDEKQVMKDWWNSLKKIDKALQLKSEFPSAKMVNEVTSKVVEPAYNFYKIEPQKVTDRLGTMSILLVFYVFYTIWWGYALYHLFEGFGLTTKKVKVKKEV